MIWPHLRIKVTKPGMHTCTYKLVSIEISLESFIWVGFSFDMRLSHTPYTTQGILTNNKDSEIWPGSKSDSDSECTCKDGSRILPWSLIDQPMGTGQHAPKQMDLLARAFTSL